MTWQLSMALRGDLEKFLDAEVRAGKSAVTTIIRRRTTNMKNDLRRQIRRAGLGQRLGNAVRGDTFPRRGSSLNAAGVVRSKAIVKHAGGISDLIQVLDKGAVIKASGKRFLAIPVDPKLKGRGVKHEPVSPSPKDFKPGTFRFIPWKNKAGASLVFASDPARLAFILVKQVKQKKKIDIDKAYAKAIRGLDEAIVAQWERNSSRVATRFGVGA